jgi:hypothetical protein
MVFMIPLWIWVAWRGGFMKFIKSSILLILSSLVWIVPTCLNIGGVWVTWQLFIDTSRGVYLSFPGISQVSLWANILLSTRRILALLWSSLNFGIVVLIISIGTPFAIGWSKDKAVWQRVILLCLWMLPAILFYIFIFFFNPGYLLTFYPTLLILVAVGLVMLSNYMAEIVNKSSYLILCCGVALMTVISAGSFMITGAYVPNEYNLSASQITFHNKQLQDFVSSVRKTSNPQQTVIFFMADYFHVGYRSVAYYLPEYRVCNKSSTAISMRAISPSDYRCSSFGVEHLLTNIKLSASDKYIVVYDQGKSSGMDGELIVAGTGISYSIYDLDTESGKAFLGSYKDIFVSS